MEQELIRRAVSPLLAWYRVCKRDLPWRHDRTPYTALVAELMLQQTRVEAVRERYVQFLDRFPTAQSLAAASEDEVLKLWEGLGYYSRARNLHRAAKAIARSSVSMRPVRQERSSAPNGESVGSCVRMQLIPLPCRNLPAIFICVDFPLPSVPSNTINFPLFAIISALYHSKGSLSIREPTQPCLPRAKVRPFM